MSAPVHISEPIDRLLQELWADVEFADAQEALEEAWRAEAYKALAEEEKADSRAAQGPSRAFEDDSGEEVK